jgi:hypothetical protein
MRFRLHERIIFKWILKKQRNFVASLLQLLNLCEYGNELSGSIKCWEFLVQNLKKAAVA